MPETAAPNNICSVLEGGKIIRGKTANVWGNLVVSAAFVRGSLTTPRWAHRNGSWPCSSWGTYWLASLRQSLG